MEGGGARAHSPELIVAHVHSCMLAIVCGRSSHGALFSFIDVPLRSWAVVSIHVRLFRCGGVMLVGWWRHVAIHGVDV